MSVDVGSAVAYLDLDMSGFQSGISEARSALQDFVSSTESLSTRFQNLGSSMTSMGSSLTKSVTVPLVGLGTAMVAATASIESETKKITAYFGDVGESAARNEKLLESVYATGVTGSLESVSAAIISVRNNLGELNDADLTSITEQAIYLDETFDIDMNESLRGVNALMESFGMTATQAMDYLVKGTQEGLDKTNELGDNLAEYGPLWAQAGFSASEMFAILDNGLESGAYNLDRVNDFVKEFTIAISDGRIGDSLESYSANTQRLFRQYEMGKATASDVFFSLIRDMETTMTKQEALTVASSVWSSLGEDNALTMITALNNVNDSFTDVTGTAEQFAETMGGGTAGSIDTLKNNLVLLADTFGEKLKPLIDNLIELTSNLIEKLKGMDDKTVSMITTIGLVVAAIGPVIAIVGKLITTVGTIISVGSKLFTGVQAIATFVTGTLIPAISAINAPVLAVIAVVTALIAVGVALYKNWDEVSAWAKKAWGAITETIGNAVSAIGEFFSELGRGVSEIISRISDWLVNLWNSIVEFFSQLLSNVTDWFSNLWSSITGFLDKLVSIGSSIVEFFSSILSMVGEFFNSLFSVITESISNIIGIIVEWGRNLIEKAVEIGSNFVKSFVDAFSNLLEGIMGFVNQVLSAISDWGRNLLSKAAEIGRGFVDAIVDNVHKVGSFFSEIFDDIIGTITNLLPKMVDAGRKIITNLWDGMKNVFTSLADWVTDALGNLFKPISNMLSNLVSPIKGVFDKVGSFFSGSHAAGLDYVPYDGYVAELHQGERVLTKQESEHYDRRNSGGDTYIFNSPEAIDEYKAARLMRQTKKEMDMDM